MLRTVWKKPSIRCTPNGNQASTRSPSASEGTRSMTPELAPRPVARYPAWSDHARKPPAQTPGRSITPATDSSHRERRSSSTRPSSNTHQKSAASPSRNSTSPLSKRTSSPAATSSWSCSSLSPSNRKMSRRPSMSISRTCPAQRADQNPAPPRPTRTQRRNSGAHHAPSPRVRPRSLRRRSSLPTSPPRALSLAPVRSRLPEPPQVNVAVNEPARLRQPGPPRQHVLPGCRAMGNVRICRGPGMSAASVLSLSG